MYTPASTYRIQLNKDFTFSGLKEQWQYLTLLGIGAVYASPIFSAVPGSNHGYDVTNANQINSEIGTIEEFRELNSLLKFNNIGWIQDIVPNHMAFHPDNNRLMDVLKNGRKSLYADDFDIDWDHPVFKGKMMVPVLAEAIEKSVGDHKLTITIENKEPWIDYSGFRLPVDPLSFSKLRVPSANQSESYNFINENPLLMLDLLDKQHYKLTPWQDVDKYLNYRRFFTINGLICLRMETAKTFDSYHQLILELTQKGHFNGLRVDHIDGLMKPSWYLEKLRAAAGESVYITVEKILEKQEKLKKGLPVQGTTGYDFLAMVNNLLTDKTNVPSLHKYYRELVNNNTGTAEYIRNWKRHVLSQSFQGDLDNLCRLITGAFPAEEIDNGCVHEIVGEFLVFCPVYKLYAEQYPLNQEDRKTIEEIFVNLRDKNPHLITPAQWLEKILLGDHANSSGSHKVLLRIMQYTGPLMAKGVEDTAMYNQAAFIAHNEVGDAIDAEGLAVNEFHELMIDRRRNWPFAMNASATHDTKRGEDARARLNVISDITANWKEFTAVSLRNNKVFKTIIDGYPVPDIAEEYFIYQTLLASMPYHGKADDGFMDRTAEYIRKALRESKIHSGWNAPSTEYEDAVISFTRQILNNPVFMREFEILFDEVKYWGTVNSLSQLVLKATCPGIPDFYQGTELWDFSYVDPDNRRPVDYHHRHAMLKEIMEKQVQEEDFLTALDNQRENAGIKLWLTHCLMAERALNPHLLIHADYVPLEIIGPYKDNFLSFLRTSDSLWYLVLVPLHLAGLKQAGKPLDLKKTFITLPAHAPENWRSLWNNKPLTLSGKVVLGEIYRTNCPVVLKGQSDRTDRGSGVLLHVASLPGRYGMGSLGSEATAFVHFLKEGGFSYWQMLPFNPVDISGSPYSSVSAFAGNTALIGVDKLLQDGLIDHLIDGTKETNTINYALTQSIDEKIRLDSWNHYKNGDRPYIRYRFDQFCNNHEYWLNDYALFKLLKKKNRNRPWFKWPAEFRFRDQVALEKFSKENNEELEQIKFAQFLFHDQFTGLKAYANSFNIRIIGDMAIYVGYDSADAWSHPRLFNLDQQSKMITVAGVPPDFFSQTGQLWNMPVYDWKEMAKENYAWWRNRMAINLEYCNLLRIDHFRALSAFWEIPAGEPTAINGWWSLGPGYHFLSVMKEYFPEMPFIVEDLGDIDQEVYKLRDAFNLPGMRVLQFAFDNKPSRSLHAPHMYHPHSIVYTGTHDNNTILGWYGTDNSNNKIRQQLKDYTGKAIAEQNVVWEMVRMAWSSVAKIAIIPMQDILSLGPEARLNTPSTTTGNWKWKLQNSDLKRSTYTFKKLSCQYGRI